MLENMIINLIDTFNIVYLWTSLSKKNNNIHKFLLTISIMCITITIIEQMNLNFIIGYTIDVILIKHMYNRKLKDVILEYILVILINMFLQLLFVLLIHLLKCNFTSEGLVVELLTLLSVVIFVQINESKKYIAFEAKNNNIVIYFILTCVIYTVVFKVIWNYDNSIIADNLLFSVIIFGILVISQIITYIYLIKGIKENEKLRISNEYNEVIHEIVEEIKQRQHDFINYKNTIKGIVNVVDENDLKSEINKYMKDEDIYDDKINSLIYIDNVVIRSIVYRNICKFKKYDINFDYKIENNVLDNIFSYHEMANILNNLLNNAFEEVIKKECTKKNIRIEIFNENEMAHLIIKNRVVNHNNINLNDMFTRGYSTKNEGRRGYGLYNVQAIVNSHKGCIKISVECQEIIFDIYFNKSSVQSDSV